MLSALIVRLITRFKNYQVYRNNINSLSSLSSSQLKDIGISRFDINYIARNGQTEHV